MGEDEAGNLTALKSDWLGWLSQRRHRIAVGQWRITYSMKDENRRESRCGFKHTLLVQWSAVTRGAPI